MPLQFEPEETVLPVVSAVPPAPPVAETTRYDAATVEKVIALAQEMQTRHRETLSRDEVEALGAEIGVEPEFVRKALEQIEKGRLSNYQKPRLKFRTAVATRRPLTKRQWTIALAPAAVYTMLGSLWYEQLTGADDIEAMLIYLVWPAVMAVWLGMKGKSLRVGLLGGSLMGLAPVLLITADALPRMNSIMEIIEIPLIDALLIPCGALLGVAGTALSSLVSKQKRRPRR